MSNGESTYKCGACAKELRTVRNEDPPIRTLRSASTSELGKKVVSPGRDLILPERVSSVCTNNLIENLIQMVSKLSEEVGLLRKDNEILKMKGGKLIAAECSGSSLLDQQSVRSATSAMRGPRPLLLVNVLRPGMLHTSRNPAGATQRLQLQQLVMFPHQPRNLQKRILLSCLERETAPPIRSPSQTSYPTRNCGIQ
jgi:hypothetical protein